MEVQILSGNIMEIPLELGDRSLENMRKFHNWIKQQLIFKAKQNTNGKSLLDIACGRGGDLNKWNKAKFRNVTAFDNHTESLYETKKFDGAIKRYVSMKSLPNMPRVNFLNISATIPDILEVLNKKDYNQFYDVVSCQFSFHYFVLQIDSVLKMISKKLNTGGYFIGTASDGDIISKNLKNGNISTECLFIKKLTEETYSFNIISENTTRETYFQIKGESIEYFLSKEFLINKCQYYGLECISILNFHEWKKNYNFELSDTEKTISYLNFSFMFKKV